jgi:hypothetical protein
MPRPGIHLRSEIPARNNPKRYPHSSRISSKFMAKPGTMTLTVEAALTRFVPLIRAA